MIKTLEEIMSAVQGYVGEDTSDEALTFLQDVRDTIAANNNAARISELETQLAEQDKAWRKRYRDTFFGAKPVDDSDDSDNSDSSTPKNFDDLFSVK